MDIKPIELTLDIKPNDFKSWVDNAKFYYRQCGIAEQEKEDQRNFFFTMVSADVKSRIQLDIVEETGFNECIELVKNAFSERNPLITLRWRLMNMKQIKSELFLDYLARFTTTWYDAKFDTIDMKDLFSILVVNGITDETLKSKLSCLEELTEEVIKRKAREHTRKAMISGESEKTLNTDASKGQKKTKMTGKCFRCTRNGHPAFACKAICYCKICKSDTHAEGSKYCKKGKGNAKQAPKKKWKSRQTDGEEDSGEEDDECEDSERTSYEEYNTRETKEEDESDSEFAHQMKETSKSAPFIEICFNAEGKRFQVNCVADTGSSKGIMSTRISNSNNLTVDKNRIIRLFNANGKRMIVEGVATMKCYPKLINGKINKLQRKSIKTEFIVSSDLKSDILLSCTDLKRMGVIPEDFPNVTVRESCNEATELDNPEDNCMESNLDDNMEGLTQWERKEVHDLIKEFDDVL